MAAGDKALLEADVATDNVLLDNDDGTSPILILEAAGAPAGGRIMSSLAASGGLAGTGGIAGQGGGLAGQ